MTHDHDHDTAHHHDHASDHAHDHAHAHSHDHAGPTARAEELNAAALDAAVPDRRLTPTELSRRNLLRAAGLTGAAGAGLAAMSGVTPAMAAEGRRPGPERPSDPQVRYWLAGDHHIHTQHSSDAQYRVIDHAQHARAYGLDWIVITDHGGATHARIGVDKVNPDIVKARADLPDTLIFQGLEWNIPAAEHGTVFVAPGRNEVAVLKQFENDYDGSVKNASANTPENEALAVAGIQWLGGQVRSRAVSSALFLANHPARNGIDSPHEIRAWRDADPTVAIGFEGAPGHQAAGLPAGYGPGSARGFYGNAPSANSFAAYPAESYRTWGGFDWMTATVGGLWDSLLAEGKPWSITANSDSHTVWADTSRRPDGSTPEQFAANGRYGDPVYAGAINLTNGDFWPGYYSRTHVGAADRSYTAVMRGMREGKLWVDHGALVKSLDARVRSTGRGRTDTQTLGGTVITRRGSRAELTVLIDVQDRPNWSQFVPQLARVDLIRGKVDPTSASNRDTFVAPETKVVAQWDVSGRTGTVQLTFDLGVVEQPFYVRLRGTDGKRSQPGYLGAGVDPAGPAIDVVGSADPWQDLWFYTNPIWGGAELTTLLGLDTGSRDLAGVDYVVHLLGAVLDEVTGVRPAYVASTHVVSPGGHHHAVAAGWAAPAPPGLLDAVSAALPGAGVVLGADSTGPADLVLGARDAVRTHAARASGRLACFPGQADVERRISAAAVIEASIVDEVVGLAGTEVGPGDEVDLTGFVRPTWHEGRCTVLVQRAASGLVPFELREQHACCSSH